MIYISLFQFSYYEFKINKPLWKQWWFIIAIVAAAAGLLFWYIKKSVLKIKIIKTNILLRTYSPLDIFIHRALSD